MLQLTVAQLRNRSQEKVIKVKKKIQNKVDKIRDFLVIGLVGVLIPVMCNKIIKSK